MTHEALARERKFVETDLGPVTRDGEFSGHASLFGTVDLAGDVVERGAFARAIRERGAGGIRMLFQHDPAEPIGTWLEMREDERGLFVRGRLAPGVARAREVLELMRGGALDGLSIGFRTVRARKEGKDAKGPKGPKGPKGVVRRILEADLWEVSVVTFPMLPGARVEAVKGLPSVREFERWLTRDARLTRGEARTVIARGYSSLMRERDAAPGSEAALAGRIREATRLISNEDMRHDQSGRP